MVRELSPGSNGSPVKKHFVLSKPDEEDGPRHELGRVREFARDVGVDSWSVCQAPASAGLPLCVALVSWSCCCFPREVVP